MRWRTRFDSSQSISWVRAVIVKGCMEKRNNTFTIHSSRLRMLCLRAQMYKYRALTDCATGASAMTSLYEATSIDFFSYICRSEMFLIIKATEMCKFSRILPFPLAIYRQHEVQFLYVSPRHVASMLLGSSCLEHTMRPQIASFSCWDASGLEFSPVVY